VLGQLVVLGGVSQRVCPYGLEEAHMRHVALQAAEGAEKGQEAAALAQCSAGRQAGRQAKVACSEGWSTPQCSLPCSVAALPARTRGCPRTQLGPRPLPHPLTLSLDRTPHVHTLPPCPPALTEK
jgi:hypothetical protein